MLLLLCVVVVVIIIIVNVDNAKVIKCNTNNDKKETERKMKQFKTITAKKETRTSWRRSTTTDESVNNL